MQDQTSEDPQKDLKSRIIEALKKIDPEDPKIQEIIKSEVKKFFAENPPPLKIRGRGEELFENRLKEMEIEFSRKTQLMRDRLNAVRDLAAVQGTTRPNESVECEEFIRNLKISIVSDSEIKFQIPGKKSKTFNRRDLGMQKSAKAWRAFCEILQDPDHIYSLGRAAHIKSAAEKTRVKDYDARRKLILLINEKLINFLGKNIGYFGIKFPKNFKLYEHQPKDPPRTFRFKFFMVEKDIGKNYSSYSRERIMEEVKRLLNDENASAKEVLKAFNWAKKLGVSDDEIT
jgi:hypothetical protein